MNPLHEQLLDILSAFDRVCRKHGIEYSLAFGTLLGAVRHGGFIPWDGDVDVMLDRTNYEKFRAVSGELGEDYFFQSKETEAAYPYNLSRIRKNGTAFIFPEWRNSGIHQGIYIDLYPVDAIADGRLRRFFQYAGIVLRTPVRIASNPVIYQKGGGGFPSWLKKLIYPFARLLPQGLCRKHEDRAITRFHGQRTRLSGVICEGGVLLRTPRDMRPFGTELTDRFEDILFEGRCFRCFAAKEALLTHWYGDYMTPPPENERTFNVRPEVLDTQKSYLEYLDRP